MYKINPDAVVEVWDKYPNVDMVYLVNGERSSNVFETKAEALQVRHNYNEYMVCVVRVSECDFAYEVAKVGRGYRQLCFGSFDTVVSAIERIVED